MFKHLTLAACFSLLAAPLFAEPHQHAQNASVGLQVAHAWARALPATAKTGAVYLHIHNQTGASDTLESASTPAAGKVELHTVEHADHVMKMVHIPTISIEANEHLMLAPGGKHLMLFDLKQPMTAGSSFPVSLKFAHAGVIEVNVSVVDQPQTEPDHSHHH